MSITRSPADARGDPFVHDQVAAKPVVLLRHVGKRALARSAPAAARPRAGRAARSARRSRRIALARQAWCKAPSRRASIWWPPVPARRSAQRRSATSTRATTTWRPSTTTPSGVSTSASVGREQVLAKLGKALGAAAGPLRALAGDRRRNRLLHAEHARAGLIGDATCSDISPGMLATLQRQRARASGWRCTPRPADAERLPFADASFDLVLGHAVLHHIPDLPRAFAEFERVLAPGGTLLFAGEPSLVGDHLASVPKRAAGTLAPLWRRVIGARAARRVVAAHDEATLEATVDVHAFAPAELSRLASDAGLHDVRITGEELLANWFGWTNRTLEATAEPRRRAVGLAPVRLPRLPHPAGARRPPAGVAPASGRLLQPDDRGAQADDAQLTAASHIGRRSLRALAGRTAPACAARLGWPASCRRSARCRFRRAACSCSTEPARAGSERCARRRLLSSSWMARAWTSWASLSFSARAAVARHAAFFVDEQRQRARPARCRCAAR